MAKTTLELCQRIKNLGYANDHSVTLYGEVFDLLSDPFTVGDDVIFVDARARRSGRVCRVRIPMNIVHMVKRDISAA